MYHGFGWRMDQLTGYTICADMDGEIREFVVTFTSGFNIIIILIH
jgi:hypothetical protein